MRPSFAPPSILLVEDDPDTQELERYVLESQGYRVTTARNGREALALLNAGLNAGSLPQLILLDLMMPDMNGWEFLRERTHMPGARAIPLVIVSAVGDPGAASARHANQVLIKPFSFDLFVATVRDLCAAASAPN